MATSANHTNPHPTGQPTSSPTEDGEQCPITVSSTSSLDTMPQSFDTSVIGSESFFLGIANELGNSTTTQSSQATTATLSNVEFSSLNHSSHNPTTNTNATSLLADPVPAPLPVHHAPQTTSIIPSPATRTPLPSAVTAMPTMMLPTSLPGLPAIAGTANNPSIPEFLFQLTKMLTDDNRHIIEWSNGKIEVHSPRRLETEVLNNYFRHSKFASFQRQLNYFGFRKQAGKGKMAPCSYVNDATTHEIASILVIKRKTSTSTAVAAKDKNKEIKKKEGGRPPPRKLPSETPSVNPVLAGILYRSAPQPSKACAPVTSAPSNPLVSGAASNTQRENQASAKPDMNVPAHKRVARAAVGRGIRHSFVKSSIPAPLPVPSATVSVPAPVAPLAKPPSSETLAPSGPPARNNDSLAQLANNYRNSLNELCDAPDSSVEFMDADPTPLDQLRSGTGPSNPFSTDFLGRDSSLVDLAMIPTLEETTETTSQMSSAPATGFHFIDFPNPEVRPGSGDWDTGS